MNVTYEHKPALTFIGYSTSIRPEEGYQKCPEFWDREYAQKYARLWQTMQPETAVAGQLVDLDDSGYVIAEEDGRTSAAGIFAAGDLRTKKLRQVVTAAADGANAVASVEAYLNGTLR